MNLYETEQMIRDGKSVTLYHFNQSKSTKIKQAAEQLRKAYKKAIKEISLTGLSDNEKEIARTKVMQGAKQDMIKVIEGELENISFQIADHKKAYEIFESRNQAAHEMIIAKYKRRLLAMTEKELRDETLKVLSGKKLLPGEFDVLSATVKNIDPTNHSVLRDEAESLHIYEPWLNDEKGHELLQIDKQLRHAQKGDVIPLDTLEGVQLLSFDEILTEEV